MTHQVRQWAGVAGMFAVIGAIYFAGASGSPHGETLSMCLIGALFLLNGLLLAIQPSVWLRLAGQPSQKLPSRTTKALLRFGGIVLVLCGLIQTINVIANFDLYWNGPS